MCRWQRVCNQLMAMAKPQPQSASLQAFVDRIEGETAVIVLSDGNGVQFELPLKYLPPNVRGGDHLIIDLQIDRLSQQETLQTVAELQRELTAANDAEQTNFQI